MAQMFSQINEHFFNCPEVEQAFIHIKDEISISNCSAAIEEIIGCNSLDDELLDEDGDVYAKKPEVINILITSSGGDMNAAFALINVIRGSHIPIRTIALGEASSAALCIFMSGHQRVVTPFTSLMSHQFNSGVEGSYGSMKNVMREFDEYYNKMTTLYQEMTGLDLKFIKKHLLGENDHFFTPEKAIEYKIADIISGLK
jgi:ATP-dependent protease ClpP protease subunit